MFHCEALNSELPLNLLMASLLERWVKVGQKVLTLMEFPSQIDQRSRMEPTVNPAPTDANNTRSPL
jgi:hypothetical protein